MKSHQLIVAILATMFLIGCGSGDERASSDETGSVDRETANEMSAPVEGSSATASTESTNAPLEQEDIDRWQRGMQAELQAVEEASESLSRAETNDDELNAMMAANETSTRSAGAQAAGLSEERYQFVRRTLSSAVKNLSPIEMEMDTSQMPESMIEQFDQSRQQSLERMGDVLPDDVIETLRERAAELREQDVSLTRARLDVAEAVRLDS